MRYGLYSVKDVKALTFTGPFLGHNDATAGRIVQDIIASDVNHPFAKHTEDFALYRVGFFDDAEGVVAGGPNGPEFICDLALFRQ